MSDASQVSLDKIGDNQITDTMMDAVEKFLKQQIKDRKQDQFRVDAEFTWVEVDRQMRLKALQPVLAPGQDPDQDWHNAIELGDLSRAGEIIAADVLRLMFPDDRSFIEVHSDIRDKEDKNSEDPAKDLARKQKKIDRRVRAYMTQQHMNFGFKQRFKLSTKEALMHGGMVAEVQNQTMTLVHGGGGIEQTKAPAWIPHSMWNCFPDPSASVSSKNLFYDGSMLIRSWEKFEVFKRRNDIVRKDKIKIKRNKIRFADKTVETKDIEVFRWFGPITIPRDDAEDLFVPNVIATMANNILVKLEIPETPYPPIIYSGYEHQDVQDPYYTSPLMKSSPLQTFNSRSANKFLDGVDLHTEPPVTVNANAPSDVDNDGPVIAPGAITKVTTKTDVQTLVIGDPQVALAGLRWGIDQMNQNLGSDANRAGVAEDTKQTATEIRNKNQRAEVRTVDWIEDLEDGPIKQFLYMQHHLNHKNGENTTFYNPEPGQPDFETMVVKKDLPKRIHFEVVGSKGVLGEDKRAEGIERVTAFMLSHPKSENIPNMSEVAKVMYQDVGVKRAETILNLSTDEEQDKVDARVKALQDELAATTLAAEETQTALQEEIAAGKEEAAQAVQKQRVTELNKREADVREQESRLVAEGLRNSISDLKAQMSLLKLQMATKDQLIKSTEEIRKAQGFGTTPNATKGDDTPLNNQ